MTSYILVLLLNVLLFITVQNQQTYFVAESAMYELFKYCKQYSEQLIENLEGDGLKSLATNFEKLLEEFQ